MFKRVLLYDSYSSGSKSSGTAFLTLGLMLIGFGVLVFIMPALLVAIVSAVFIGLGMLCLSVWLGLKASKNDTVILEKKQPWSF